MADLLRAGLYRLFRYRLFWLALALVLLVSLVFLARCAPVLPQGRSAIEANSLPLDMWVLVNLGPIGLAYVASVLCPALDGTDFSSGAVRNRISRGCSRSAVFFASLLCQLVAILILLAAYYAPFFLLGDVWRSQQIAGMGWTVQQLAVTAVLCAICFTCLFHLIGTLVEGRAGLIAAPAVLIALTVASVTMANSLLEAPETEIYTYSVEEGVEASDVERVPNPAYVSEEMRPVLEFWEHAMPTGCATAGLVDRQSPSYWLYIGVDCVLFTVAGAVLFSRHRMD